MNVQTNTPIANTIDIAGGATLDIMGADDGTNAGAFVVGTPATSLAPVTTSLAVAGTGTLHVGGGGGGGNFIVGVGSGNGSFGGFTATLDMSQLANFVYDGTGDGNFFVGYGTRSTGIVHLANSSNTITATDLVVGDSAQTPGFSSLGADNNGGGTSRLYLGAGTNTLDLGGTLTIGNTQAAGIVQFESAAGSLAIGGEDPVGNPGQVPDIIVGRQSAGSGAATSSLLLAGHTATIGAGTVTVGAVARRGRYFDRAGHLRYRHIHRRHDRTGAARQRQRRGQWNLHPRWSQSELDRDRSAQCQRPVRSGQS